MRQRIKNISMIMSCIGIIGLGIFGFGGLIKSNALTVTPEADDTKYEEGSSQGAYYFKLEAYVDDNDADPSAEFAYTIDNQTVTAPTMGTSGSCSKPSYFKVDEVPKQFNVVGSKSGTASSDLTAKLYHLKLTYKGKTSNEQIVWEYYNYCTADEINFTANPITISPMVFTKEQAIIWEDENDAAIEHDSYLFRLDIQQLASNDKENANIDIEFHQQEDGTDRLANLEINIGSLAESGTTKYFRSNRIPKFLVVRCAKYGSGGVDNTNYYTKDELDGKLTIEYLGCDIQEPITANLLDVASTDTIDYGTLSNEITFADGGNWQTYVPIANAEEGVRSNAEAFAFKAVCDFEEDPGKPIYCKVNINDNYSIVLKVADSDTTGEVVKYITSYNADDVKPSQLKVGLWEDEACSSTAYDTVTPTLYFIGLDGQEYDLTSITDLTTGDSNAAKAYAAAAKVGAEQLSVIDKIKTLDSKYNAEANEDERWTLEETDYDTIGEIIIMNENLDTDKLEWENYRGMAEAIELFKDYKMTFKTTDNLTISIPNYATELNLGEVKYPVLSMNKADGGTDTWLDNIINCIYAYKDIKIVDFIDNSKEVTGLSSNTLTIKISGVTQNNVESVYIYDGTSANNVSDSMSWENDNDCTISITELSAIPQGIAIAQDMTGGGGFPPTDGDDNDDTQNPDDGSGDDTQNPDDGSGDDTQNPDDGSGDDTQNPDDGSGDDTQNPDDGSLSEDAQNVVDQNDAIDLSTALNRDDEAYAKLKALFEAYSQLSDEDKEAIKDKLQSAKEKFEELNSQHNGIIALNLPDFVKLVVEKIDESSAEWDTINEKLSGYDILSLYDINLKNALGEEVNYIVKDGEIFIIRIPAENIENVDEFDEIWIKHITESGKIETIQTTLTEDGEYYEFRISSFSPVAVIGVNNLDYEDPSYSNSTTGTTTGIASVISSVKTGNEAPIAMAVMGIISLAGVGFFARKKSEEK